MILRTRHAAGGPRDDDRAGPAEVDRLSTGAGAGVGCAVTVTVPHDRWGS
ncbi:hypothetical protein ABZ793_31965 [Micromonospora sp. NPDC047465]